MSPKERSKTEIIQDFPLNLHNKAEILHFRNKGEKKVRKNTLTNLNKEKQWIFFFLMLQFG